MKKIISTAMMLFVMMQTNVAFADADPVAIANATSNVNAGAAASADNNLITTNTSTLGVTLAPGAVATNATAGASTSQIGDVSVQTGSTSLIFQGSSQKIPPMPAPLPFATGSVPQLIPLPQNATVQEAGLALAMFYDEVCPSPAVRGYEDELKSRTFNGASGNTQIVFVPNLNYAKVVAGWGRKDVVEEVFPIAFDKSGYFKCLGIMTISAKDKDTGEVPASVILSDAKNFPLEKMKGFKKITLYSKRETITTTKGVDNSGHGLGLGAGAAQFFNPLLATVGASASSSSGVTYPGTKIGATFLVLVKADPESEGAVFIDLSPKKPEPVPMAIAPPPEIDVVMLPPEVIVVPPAVIAPPVEAKAVEPVVAPPVITENKTAVVPVVVATATKPKKKVAKKLVIPKQDSAIIQCTNCIVNGTIKIPSPLPVPSQTPKKPDQIGMIPSWRTNLGL